MEIADDITSLVGKTPLVKLNRIRKQFNCYPEIIAKLESFNPSASVKDRIAYSMLSAAEKDGFINEESVLENLSANGDEEVPSEETEDSSDAEQTQSKE